MIYNRFSIVEFQSSSENAQVEQLPSKDDPMAKYTSMIKLPHFVQDSKRGDKTKAKMSIKSTEIFIGKREREWLAYRPEQHVVSNNSGNEKGKVSNSGKKIKTSELLPAANLINNNISHQPATNIGNYSNSQKSSPTPNQTPHLVVGNTITLNANTRLIVALLTNNQTTNSMVSSINNRLAHSNLFETEQNETISRLGEKKKLISKTMLNHTILNPIIASQPTLSFDQSVNNQFKPMTEKLPEPQFPSKNYLINNHQSCSSFCCNINDLNKFSG